MSLKVFLQSPDTFGERRYDPEITIEALKVSVLYRPRSHPPLGVLRYKHTDSSSSDLR